MTGLRSTPLTHGGVMGGRRPRGVSLHHCPSKAGHQQPSTSDWGQSWPRQGGNTTSREQGQGGNKSSTLMGREARQGLSKQGLGNNKTGSHGAQGKTKKGKSRDKAGSALAPNTNTRQARSQARDKTQRYRQYSTGQAGEEGAWQGGAQGKTQPDSTGGTGTANCTRSCHELDSHEVTARDKPDPLQSQVPGSSACSHTCYTTFYTRYLGPTTYLRFPGA